MPRIAAGLIPGLVYWPGFFDRDLFSLARAHEIRRLRAVARTVGHGPVHHTKVVVPEKLPPNSKVPLIVSV